MYEEAIQPAANQKSQIPTFHMPSKSGWNGGVSMSQEKAVIADFHQETSVEPQQSANNSRNVHQTESYARVQKKIYLSATEAVLTEDNCLPEASHKSNSNNPSQPSLKSSKKKMSNVAHSREAPLISIGQSLSDSGSENVLSEAEKQRLNEVLMKINSKLVNTQDDRKMSVMVKDVDTIIDDSDEEPDLIEGFFIVPEYNNNNNNNTGLTMVLKRQKPEKRKILVYDYKSLYTFHHQTKFRQFIVMMVNNPIFENFVILAIALNSLLLSIYDYSDRENETEYNKILENVSMVFTIIFSLEMFFKIISMGFFVHRNSYLRDYWNWLDLLVVIVGFIELMPFMQISSLRSLRILRVLRPLRSINAFPKMRIQINALLNSVPSLMNAVVFMLFIFLLFGILGVQQFEGSMYQRCRLTEQPLTDGTWPIDETIQTLCRKEEVGETQCRKGTWCKHPQDADPPRDRDIDDPINQPKIDFGLTNFDNLGYAILTIFQMITLEGWTKIMYNLMDSNVSWMAVAFCITLILICSFFILNVILAILAEAQDKGDFLEAENNKKRMRQTNKSLRREAKQRGKKVDKITASMLQRSMTRSVGFSESEEPQADQLLTEIPVPPGLFCYKKPRGRKFGSILSNSMKRTSSFVKSSSLPPEFKEDNNGEFSSQSIESSIAVTPVQRDNEMLVKESQESVSPLDASQAQLMNGTFTKYAEKNTSIQNELENTISGDAQNMTIAPLDANTTLVAPEVMPKTQGDVKMLEDVYDGPVPSITIAPTSPAPYEQLAKKSSMKPLKKTSASEPLVSQSQSGITGINLRRANLQSIDEEQADGSQRNDTNDNDLIRRHQTMKSVTSPKESREKPTSSSQKKRLAFAVTIEEDKDQDMLNAQQNAAELAFTVSGVEKTSNYTTGTSYTTGTLAIPERAMENRCNLFFYNLCTHPVFTLFIILMIIWNTIVLASDSFPPDKEYQARQEILNTVFTYCFLAEMVIKLLGLGVREYAKDTFNLFDASIVLISMIEIGMEQLDVGFANTGAFSAFRSIRLLRTFKLVRSWKEFHKLLQKLLLTIKGLTTFMVLLSINMLIFTLCGMQLFGYKMKIDKYDEFVEEPVPIEDTKEIFSPRPNFDGFFNGFVTIFIMFIGEDWQVIMHEHYRGQGSTALIFFPVVYISLYLILLNLFLAILLDKFAEDEKEEEDSDEKAYKGFNKIKRKIRRWWRHNIPKMQAKIKPTKLAGQDEEQIQGDKMQKLNFLSPDKAQINNHIKVFSLNINKDDQSDMPDDFNSSAKKIIENAQPVNSHKDEQSLASDELSLDISGNSRELSHVELHSSVSENTVQKDSERGKSKSAKKAQTTINKSMREISSPNSPNSSFKSQITENNQEMFSFERSPTQFFKEKRKEDIVKKKRKQFADSGQKLTQTQIKKRQMEREAEKLSQKKQIPVEGKSLGIFGPENCLRKICYSIVSKKHYDNAVLLLIGISTILLTLDNPLSNKTNAYAHTLKYIDYLMTAIFTLECIINVILFGLIMNGPSSYLKSNWNQMDMVIVILAIVSVAVEGSGLSLNYLKVFRMLRVLRPLRVLKRNQGMQIQVLSLINASAAYGNLMLITFLVLILFGIQGITFFKGKFNYCNSSNISEDAFKQVVTMWDCYDAGGEWTQYNSNFDNIQAAVITMFNLMTTEGWVETMWHAVDSTNIYQMPERNANPFNVFFFMVFLIIGSMILLNAFVGVVVISFVNEKKELTKENRLTELQRDYCEVIIKCYTAVPRKLYEKSGNKFRDFIYEIAVHEHFDTIIFFCIVLNTICLALSWYGQPLEYRFYLTVFNYIFTAIYTLEFLIKFIAFKRAYFDEYWNVFDFTIVVSAAIGIILEGFFNIDIGNATTIIRSFRIARILKVVRFLPTLQKIVYTFVVAIPELANVGGLLILFIYLYSVLGVFLFAHIKYSEHLNEHANFRNFPSAALTLFRIVTGEGWQEIMYNCARQRGIGFSCVDSQTWEEQQVEILGCGDPLPAYMYFISYMVIVAFIFLNLFLVIILDGYYKANDEMRLSNYHNSIDLFIATWMKYDKKATGMISTADLHNVIMDLLLAEYKEIDEMRGGGGIIGPDVNVFFNLHKKKVATMYFKWKIVDNEYKCDEASKKMMQKLIDQTIELKEINRNKRLKRHLHSYMNRFLGSFEIPVYNKLTNYNFYDTLDSLLRRMFTEMHSYNFHERQARIEHSEKPDELPWYDRIVPDSPQFWALEQSQFELILEVSNEDFQTVLNRLEKKPDDEKIQTLEKMIEIRGRQTKKVKKSHKIDMFGGNIIDSNLVNGAKVILKFAVRKKALFKRRLVQGRLNTGMKGLFTKQLSLFSPKSINSPTSPQDTGRIKHAATHKQASPNRAKVGLNEMFQKQITSNMQVPLKNKLSKENEDDKLDSMPESPIKEETVTLPKIGKQNIIAEQLHEINLPVHDEKPSIKVLHSDRMNEAMETVQKQHRDNKNRHDLDEKLGLKSHKSDSKRGNDSGSHSVSSTNARNMSGCLNVGIYSPPTEKDKVEKIADLLSSNNKSQATAMSPKDKNFPSKTHNRDNKSPRPQGQTQEPLNIFSDNTNPFKRGKEAVTYKPSRHHDSEQVQDDDAGGGLPKRRDESFQNSPDSSHDKSREDNSYDRKELQKIHHQLKKHSTQKNGGKKTVPKGQSLLAKQPFVTSTQMSLKEDGKGGDTVSSFRQTIRDQLRKESPSANSGKKVLQNKLKLREQAENMREIITSNPSFNTIMHENMSKLGQNVTPNQRFNNSKTLSKKLTEKLVNKQHYNSTLDKFNFSASQFHIDTNSPIRIVRPQSIEANAGRRNNYIDVPKKGNRHVSQDSRKSSHSLRPVLSHAGLTRVTKAKLLKIERLKQLYVQK